MIRKCPPNIVDKRWGGMTATHLTDMGDTYSNLPFKAASNPATAPRDRLPVPVPALTLFPHLVTGDLPTTRDMGRVITARINKAARCFMIITDTIGGGVGNARATAVCAQRLLVDGNGDLHLDHEGVWLYPAEFQSGRCQAWSVVSPRLRTEAMFQAAAVLVCQQPYMLTYAITLIHSLGCVPATLCVVS